MFVNSLSLKKRKIGIIIGITTIKIIKAIKVSLDGFFIKNTTLMLLEITKYYQIKLK
jgi:hypothetical protein